MRIWVDGCFDFFHHGHAGALNQARELGDELVVGIHSDEEILVNKGPVVMHLDERELAVNACRWTSQEVTGAPYVTQFDVIDKYGCEFVAHGDDITTDANGNDCYQAVKDAGRFREFKRTPNISTTDLIGRMLSKSVAHHLDCDTQFLRSDTAQSRFRMYAKAADAKTAYAGVFDWQNGQMVTFVTPEWKERNAVYVEGTFDLFHSGHIEFLKSVRDRAGTSKILVGLRSDSETNRFLGNGQPIMNIFERALCVLQCKYVDGVIMNAPVCTNGSEWIALLEEKLTIDVVSIAKGCKKTKNIDRITAWAEENGKLMHVSPGKYAALDTNTIIDRVLANRAQYLERQRNKGVKAATEKNMEERERTQKIRDNASTA